MIVYIRIDQNLNFVFLPRDTEKSETLDVVDFRDVAFSVKISVVYEVS